MRIEKTGEVFYRATLADDGGERSLESFKTEKEADEFIRFEIKVRAESYEFEEFDHSQPLGHLTSEWLIIADERFWIEPIYIKRIVPSTLEVMEESCES